MTETRMTEYLALVTLLKRNEDKLPPYALFKIQEKVKELEKEMIGHYNFSE